MTCICPLCENPIPAPDRIKIIPDALLVLWPTGHVQLTEAQFTIFELVFNQYPRPVSIERLAMRYYSTCKHEDDPPCDSLVRVHIYLMRKRLKASKAPFWVDATNNYGAGYILRHIEQEKTA